MLGGYHDQAPEAEHIELFNSCVEHVNAKLTLTSVATDWKVHSVQTQVVAGTNYKYKAEHHGKHYQIVVFKPLPHTGGHPEVSHAALC